MSPDFVYQQTDTITTPNAGIDTLQFIGQEEGRIRWAYHKYTTGTSAYGFEYDFFEKDHLGNTRMVLTQQKDTAKYLASGEAVYRATESQLFNNLTTTTIARTGCSGLSRRPDGDQSQRYGVQGKRRTRADIKWGHHFCSK